MKKNFKTSLKILFIVFLCAGILVGCDDDDDKKNVITNAIADSDPSQGFIVNSLDYRVVIDFNEKEEFNASLDPGMILEINLTDNTTHLLHVVVLNGEGRIISEYSNSFYIDNIPLDNQLKDFLCSWYIDLVSESGYGNDFGS